MKHAGTLLYLITFYICLIYFFWNFKSFSEQERIIVLLIVSGVQCLSVLHPNSD